jgi:uncharacterized protein
MMTGTFYQWNKNNLLLELQIQAKASKDAVIGEYNNRLKISITTAPEAGKANDHLVKFLAKYFGVPQKHVRITKGHKNKYKSVSILEPKSNLDKLITN